MNKRKLLVVLGITFFCLSFTGCKKKTVCEKNGHDFSDATCLEASKCKECGEVNGSSLGHDLKKNETVNPTCLTDGYDLYKCTRCDYTEKETILSIGHSLIYDTNNNSLTCTSGIVTVESCEHCDYKKEIITPATGHKWVNATWSAPKHCSVCNLIELEPTLYKEYLSVGESTTIYFEGFDDLEKFNVEIADESIVSIDEFGKITALNKGVTEISFSLKDKESNVISYTFEVISKMPNAFVTYDRMAVGEITTIFFRNLEELEETSLDDFNITFKNGGILELTEDGYIKAIALGKEYVNIISKLDERVYCTVEVNVVDENSILIVYGRESVNTYEAGDQFMMSASMGYDNEDLEWMSSDPSVAVVSADGLVSIVKEGYVVINVYDPNFPKDNNRKARYAFYIEGVMNVDYVARIIYTALEENGTRETGSNWQKYGEWYGNNGEPWCATFVSWCWNRCGLPTSLLVKYQGCTAGMQWCTEQDIMHYVQDFEWLGNNAHLNDKVIVENYQPASGDIVFFLSAGMGHTGIVIYSDETYLYTIEGNTSDMVAVKRWTLTDARITGYAHPKYPTYDGTPEDFSWIREKQADGTYIWSNVSAQQKVD